ncbi:MAG: protein-export membrane protein SecF [Chloroflexi bacterium RBG_13_51_52]|nr:MAG: protein-export membrane protein SecF [Chloroflexi bacterium RBG_13_51_52]
MLDIIGKRFWYFLISGILIVVAIISLVAFGLKPSIEFSSGSILSLRFETPVEYDDFLQEMTDMGYNDAIIQRTGGGQFLIRTHELTDAEKAQLESSLTARFGTLSEASFNSVSPMVASETARNAAIAVAVAMVGMLLYVTYAFRKMPRPFRWGTCFVIALLHDILVTIGLFSLLGRFFGWEMNLMFITGILAIVGVSLDNTIVVFDRMRENQKSGVSPDFEVVVNRSQIETLGRSLNTSITILITCLALLIFVGGTIQNFIIVLMVGVIAGTFDSVFVAPGLLVVWDKNEWGRFFGRKKSTPVKV